MEFLVHGTTLIGGSPRKGSGQLQQVLPNLYNVLEILFEIFEILKSEIKEC